MNELGISEKMREALQTASDMERDHQAMEKLRSASLKRGWKWRWDGLYQLEQTTDTQHPTFKDPADAIHGYTP